MANIESHPAEKLVSGPTSCNSVFVACHGLFSSIYRGGELRTLLKRIPPNNFDSHREIDGIGPVGDRCANGFVECGFDFSSNRIVKVISSMLCVSTHKTCSKNIFFQWL